jgi:sugar/nucleoside kinase (ribokinase family)
MVNMDLIGLTNALTDITFEVTEKEFRKIGIKKGSYTPLKEINWNSFSEVLKQKEIKFCVAGSPANVILNASKLGLKAALFGSVGYDDIGENYIRTLNENEILAFINQIPGDSGFCYIIITPDGERTNTANLGVSRYFDFDFSKIKGSKFFHTSGYELVTNPEKVKEAIECAKNYGVKLSFDLADRTMVRQQRTSLENLVEKIDVLFVTEEEAKELTGESPYKSLELLSKICPIVALKRGKNGSVVKSKNERHKISIYPVKVVNTCGAGDAYASGFLFAYIRGLSIKECGCMGSYIASRVCASSEAHL